MYKYLFSLLFLGCLSCQMQSSDSSLRLWYKQPAKEWMEATPTGNGRLGAMIYGGTQTETIALNEITMWAGQADENQEIPCGKEKLAEMRQLFFAGKLIEGNQMATQYLSGTPHSFGTHVPVGDLKIDFGYDTTRISDYTRQLDLTTGVTTVGFKVDGIGYKREYFCSNPDNVLVMRFTADKGNSLDFETGLALLRKATVTTEGNELVFTGKVDYPQFGPGGVNFIGKINIAQQGGTIEAREGKIRVKGADEAILTLDIRTDYKNPGYRTQCAQTLAQAGQQSYEQLKKAHMDDYTALFNRVEIDLGNSEADNLPTDIRWSRIKSGAKDPGLDALFFQYGRYLLISSSRENSPLPANLQGVWNDNLACNMSWSCDYHLDINTEQNYWASNVTNLHECNQPFFNYIESLSKDGEKTARRVYGSPGWVAHTVTNVWGNTAPGGGVNWGLFPVASCWVASHLWSHYCYTQDQEFLKNQAYPILKKNAIFFLDYMTTDPNTGYLVTGPTNSAENSFKFNGWELALSMMPTCDRVLVHELYTSCIEASKILNTDTGFRDSLQQALAKFPPLKIGKNGEVQEWMEDFEQAHPNHRHASHLLALYPFAQISVAHTPELAQAAKKAIDNKLAAPDWEDVEFSRANMINFYARLKEPEEAYNSVCYLLQKLTRENLLTVSPKGIAGAPWDIFIFDGNQAGISGIAEMLVQNHEGYIEFLPALPQAWPTGSYKGLCVKGGAETDLKWQNGKVTAATVKATTANTFRLKLPAGTSNPKSTLNGKTYTLSPDNEGIITLELSQGDCFELKY
ncbi:glycoside hydrolase family 95 protein [Odoribacter splanchnicus]|uniref:glycoside hydrolase family 95 protein n=1 Tax=Odoribacter splanchnicus TaxID=28118 RepID=UPI0032C0EF19